jgi:hypothetical protein
MPQTLVWRASCSTEGMAGGLPNFCSSNRRVQVNFWQDAQRAAAPARFSPNGAFFCSPHAREQLGRRVWDACQAQRLSLGTRGKGSVQLGTRGQHAGCQHGGAGVMQFGRSQLHVGIVAASQWKVDAELRIEQCKHVQAAVLFLASHARSHIERDPQLMARDASHNSAATSLGFHRMRSTCAGTFFALAHTGLLF